MVENDCKWCNDQTWKWLRKSWYLQKCEHVPLFLNIDMFNSGITLLWVSYLKCFCNLLTGFNGDNIAAMAGARKAFVQCWYWWRCWWWWWQQQQWRWLLLQLVLCCCCLPTALSGGSGTGSGSSYVGRLLSGGVSRIPLIFSVGLADWADVALTSGRMKGVKVGSNVGCRHVTCHVITGVDSVQTVSSTGSPRYKRLVGYCLFLQCNDYHPGCVPPQGTT